MTYQLVQTPRFVKALKKLDRQIARRILVALYELVDVDDPVGRLKPLQHELAGLWRLRVGDYRIIVDVQRAELMIVALDADHRSKIYED